MGHSDAHSCGKSPIAQGRAAPPTAFGEGVRIPVRAAAAPSGIGAGGGGKLFTLQAAFVERTFPSFRSIDGHDIETLGQWPETAHEATPCVG